MSSARILEQKFVAKVWGRTDLPPPFVAADGKRIGEIWFEPPPECDGVLVKYLFTDAKLSVQVHPSDAQAGEGENGKEECWYVLDAEAGAQLAIGLKSEIDEAGLRAAALDGSIEQLLEWHNVAAGDFFYLPAGTIHAIGPGLSLVEVQQNSDTTYRLYDYGRPRELHLDAALRVAKRGPHDARHRRKTAPQGHARLVSGPHFRFDRIDGSVPDDVASNYRGQLLVAPLTDGVTVSGEAIPAGHCALAGDIGDVALSGDAQALLTQPV